MTAQQEYRGHSDLGPLSVQDDEQARIERLGQSDYRVDLLHRRDCDYDLEQDSVSPLCTETDANSLPLTERLQHYFPLPWIAPVSSDRAAFALIFQAMRDHLGDIVQNGLPYRARYHLVDVGYEFLDLTSRRANSAQDHGLGAEIDLDQLEDLLQRRGVKFACVLLESCGLGQAGQPLTLAFMRRLATLLRAHAIPLVLEASHLLDTALLEVGADLEQVPAALAEYCRLSDVLCAGLGANFGAPRGGLIACRDEALFQVVSGLAELYGNELEHESQQRLSQALANPRALFSAALARMTQVSDLYHRLAQCGAPLLGPVGNHCLLFDAERLAPGLENPAPALAASLFAATGIRCTLMPAAEDRIVALCLPIGLSPIQVEDIGARLHLYFSNPRELPTLVRASARHQGRSQKVFQLQGQFPRSRHVANHAAHLVQPAALSCQDLPLSEGQLALWFLQRQHPNSIAYNLPTGLRIRRRIDRALLARCVAALPERHAILRARAVSHDERPSLRLAGDFRLELRSEDDRALSHDARIDRLRACDAEPFDLERGPLVRATLFTWADDDHVLLLTFHHLIFDGTSFLILMASLRELYAAGLARRTLPPRHEEAALARFAQDQAERLASPAGQINQAFWLEQLAGELPVFDMLGDYPRPPVLSGRGAFIVLPLPDELLQRVKTLARRHQTSLFVFLLATFKLLLHKMTGARDLIVATTLAGRTHAEIEDVVGYFINLLPLRSQLAQTQRFDQLLVHLRNLALEAMACGDVPFMRTVSKLRLVRDESRTPVAQVCFNMLDWGISSQEEEALPLEPVLELHQAGDFDLVLEVLIGTTSKVIFNYNPDLFESARIRALYHRYLHLLEAVTADPSLPLWHYSACDAAERSSLLERFQVPLRPHPAVSIVHQIEAQAAQRPNALAVRDGQLTLSHAELDRAVHQLAAVLSARGIGPETLVATLLPRSAALVVAELAILAAGAAYRWTRSTPAIALPRPSTAPARARSSPTAPVPRCWTNAPNRCCWSIPLARRSTRQVPYGHGDPRSTWPAAPMSFSPAARPACPRAWSSAMPA